MSERATAKPRTEADDTARLKDVMRSELLRILIGRDDHAIDDLVDTLVLLIDLKVAHASIRTGEFVGKVAEAITQAGRGK